MNVSVAVSPASIAALNPAGIATAIVMAERSSSDSTSPIVRSRTSISSSASSRRTNSRAWAPPSISTTWASALNAASSANEKYISANRAIGSARLKASSARFSRYILSSRRAMCSGIIGG